MPREILVSTTARTGKAYCYDANGRPDFSSDAGYAKDAFHRAIAADIHNPTFKSLNKRCL